ncbi:asparagine synthase (glutamine-hydrolyzing) [Fluviispira multicolorata]|uniref:asparagine synthase (glutamine-hydrolyzing) n=1 Tax=Fluviispira multicolorata TaxID=2654512 RepID=A0A833N381_9BACT|nr:asparagine synthase (glutamine-hydrolyzing) [Fluviispira multicolorata]KAB8029699.1 asparagine synthase (glutamine-hydrolyzing) [Fluviispira multicolorata]
MCGIAGVINFNHQPTQPQLLASMLNVLKHRGPDQDGTYHQGHVSIGMRRLKIIALDNGAQPCFSNDGRYVLVFNGEIYNYRSLRNELMAQGFLFDTDSDAEVIVNLYQRDGESFYQQLDGMFALAIFDRINETLYLARDPVGKKPLFYAFHNDTVSFSSELNSLLKNPTISRRIDPVALDYYLRFRVVPSDRCIFQGVSKVPAGGGVSFKHGKKSKHHYWSVDYQPVEEDKPLEQWVDEIDECLNQAISKRMTAEVPIGTMLSGGLDSSLITAMACKQQGHRKLKTFAVGFNESAFNELDYSQRLAKDLGTDHHDHIITQHEAFDVAHSLVGNFGEPFAFPSSMASYFMYHLARKHVTVVLGGDGADELFGGYARYSLVANFPHLPFENRLPRKVDLFNKTWQVDSFPDFYQALLTDGAGSQLRQLLYSKQMTLQLAGENRVVQVSRYKDELALHADPLSAAMQYDFNHWMQEAQLVKIDIASMANSLEVRAPFLDKLVVGLGSRLPARLKFHAGKEKYLLHCLAKRYLPDYIINRKKQELAVPLEKWMVLSMKKRISETLTSEQALSRGYFNPNRMRQFIREFDGSHSYTLWTMYMLEKWHQQFVDNQEL